VPEGILFRVNVSAAGDDALGRLLAEADAIRPRMPDEQDAHGQPLIQHVAADDIGDELWRVTDFDGKCRQLFGHNREWAGREEIAARLEGYITCGNRTLQDSNLQPSVP
jgi:hypothetical protein